MLVLRLHSTSPQLIVTIEIVFVPWLKTDRPSRLMEIGGLWVLLTLAFEIALGRLILGYVWTRIAADYDISQGGLMPYGLVLMALSPLLAAKVRRILAVRSRTANEN